MSSSILKALQKLEESNIKTHKDADNFPKDILLRKLSGKQNSWRWILLWTTITIFIFVGLSALYVSFELSSKVKEVNKPKITISQVEISEMESVQKVQTQPTQEMQKNAMPVASVGKPTEIISQITALPTVKINTETKRLAIEEPNTDKPQPSENDEDIIDGVPTHITLEGTMSGAKPMAIIDGQILEVGDTIKGVKILEIGHGWIRCEGFSKKLRVH